MTKRGLLKASRMCPFPYGDCQGQAEMSTSMVIRDIVWVSR